MLQHTAIDYLSLSLSLSSYLSIYMYIYKICVYIYIYICVCVSIDTEFLNIARISSPVLKCTYIQEMLLHHLAMTSFAGHVHLMANEPMS